MTRLSCEITDRLLGRLLDAAPEDSSVIVVSDHGGGPWVSGGLGGLEMLSFLRSFHVDHSGNHRLDGVLVMSGPQYLSGRKIDDTGHLDLVPNVLNFFGLPVADNIPGEFHRFGITGSSDSDIRRVATYDYLRVLRDFFHIGEKSQAN